MAPWSTSSGQSQSPATWDAFQSGLGITAWHWRSPKYQREKMEHVMGNSTTGMKLSTILIKSTMTGKTAINRGYSWENEL